MLVCKKGWIASQVGCWRLYLNRGAQCDGHLCVQPEAGRARQQRPRRAVLRGTTVSHSWYRHSWGKSFFFDKHVTGQSNESFLSGTGQHLQLSQL